MCICTFIHIHNAYTYVWNKLTLSTVFFECIEFLQNWGQIFPFNFLYPRLITYMTWFLETPQGYECPIKFSISDQTMYVLLLPKQSHWQLRAVQEQLLDLPRPILSAMSGPWLLTFGQVLLLFHNHCSGSWKSKIPPLVISVYYSKKSWEWWNGDKSP